MPPVRPRIRRSARLCATKIPLASNPHDQNSRPHPAAPVTKQSTRKTLPQNAKQKATNTQAAGATVNSSQESKIRAIFWDLHHTESLLSWLSSHPSDRAVLFSERRDTTTMQAKPSGWTKKDIWAVIVKNIFETDATYGTLYGVQPDKFGTAVGNQLTL